MKKNTAARASPCEFKGMLPLQQSIPPGLQHELADAADDPLRHLRRPPPLSIFSPGDKMGAGFPGGRATVRRQACLL